MLEGIKKDSYIMLQMKPKGFRVQVSHAAKTSKLQCVSDLHEFQFESSSLFHLCVCISAIKLKQDDCDEKDDLASPLFHCSVRNILLPPFHSKPFKD